MVVAVHVHTVVANGAWIELGRVLGYCGQDIWGAGGARSNIWRACRQGSNIFKFDCRSSILCALSEWCQRVGENLFGWGNVEFGCRDEGIEQRAKEGVGGTLAKTELPWLGFRKQMARCGVNAWEGTYLGGVMWNLDAGIRESSGAQRREVGGTLAKTKRSWLGFRE